jgi:hypothetical protein
MDLKRGIDLAVEAVVEERYLRDDQGLKEFLDWAAQKDLIHQVLKKWG